MRNARYFCQAILDELYAGTEVDHKAEYLETETIFMEIDKAPSFTKVNKIGEKLTQSNVFRKNIEILEGNHEKIDSGIVTPMKEFLLLNEENKQSENEEIVEW